MLLTYMAFIHSFIHKFIHSFIHFFFLYLFLYFFLSFFASSLLSRLSPCFSWCYWPFVRGIHRSPVNSPHKGQWRGALMFSLICVWINGWVNNRGAGDLRRYRAHYDVIVMSLYSCAVCLSVCILTSIDPHHHSLFPPSSKQELLVRTSMFLMYPFTWMYMNVQHWHLDIWYFLIQITYHLPTFLSMLAAYQRKQANGNKRFWFTKCYFLIYWHTNSGDLFTNADKLTDM